MYIFLQILIKFYHFSRMSRIYNSQGVHVFLEIVSKICEVRQMCHCVFIFFFLLGRGEWRTNEGPVGIDEAPGPNPTTSVSNGNRPGSTGFNRVPTCSRFFIVASALRVTQGTSTRQVLFTIIIFNCLVCYSCFLN